MPTHEYIAGRSFNSSFKNMLRDYYTYGFKSKEEFQGSGSTYDNNYNRLKDFLQGYMDWSEQKTRKTKTTDAKKVTFITCDSQSMDCNPFHRVYRFCGSGISSYLSTFFHSLAALDSTFRLDVKDEDIDDDSWDKYYKLIESTLISMGVNEEVLSQLVTSSDTNELLEKSRKNGLSEAQIDLIQKTIRHASRYPTLKTSDLERYCSQDIVKPVEEILIEELSIPEKQKNILLSCVQDKDKFINTAREFGLSNVQIYQILDSVPASMKGVIHSIGLEIKIPTKLTDPEERRDSRDAKEKIRDFRKKREEISRDLKNNCYSRSDLETTAKKHKLSDELIDRLMSAFDEREEKRGERKERKKKQDKIKKNINNRLEKLRDIGVIQCRQRNPEYIFTEEQIDLFLKAIPHDITKHLKSKGMLSKMEDALGNFASNKSGDRNWYLSGLTIDRIIEEGRKQSPSFEVHLQHALDFYSKTFLFGEIGMFLQDRINNNYVSPFRIKHEYYMHSLNDYNAIDLMAAIENNNWCLISYIRDDIKTEILCYPIELRISSITGREYLMYYEPFKKSCSSLRLEFIESIEYYHDLKVKRCLAEFYSDDDVEISIERNLNRSRLLLDYTWGVSTGDVQEKNVENLNRLFQELFLRISYNSDTDNYILNRLYRESRIGIIVVNAEEKYIDFSVIATDINEIIPFVRSFYSRVIKCSGYDDHGFSIEIDIKNIVGQVLKDKLNPSDDSNLTVEPWRVDENFLLMLGKGMNADEHEKLFNEIFSVYYRIFAAILGKICYENRSYSSNQIVTLCNEIMNKFGDEFGPEARWDAYNEGQVFFELLTEGGFLVPRLKNGLKTYESRYHTFSKVNIYRDCLPLSEIEVRWLKTIIKDERIHYFLNEKEILSLKLILADYAIDISPFSMNSVNYFDRYKFSAKKEWKESSVLTPILEAIAKKHVIKITYLSKNKNIKVQEYQPIVIEYSKRDNRFVGYFLSCRRKEGLKEYPISEIVSVEETDQTFDMTIAIEMLKEYKDGQLTPVEIEFPDKPKLADRILTEFSPWDKRCEFDSERGVYSLIISYPKRDGKDIANRLLAFGADIRFIDKSHVLARVLGSKLKDQMDRIQNKTAKQVRSGEKTGAVR